MRSEPLTTARLPPGVNVKSQSPESARLSMIRLLLRFTGTAAAGLDTGMRVLHLADAAGHLVA